MWRCAILECIKQEAELLLCFFLANTHDVEDALLHILLVNTDGTATNFVTVADDVVCVGKSLARLLVEGVEVLRLRGGESVVDCGPLGVAKCHVAGSGGVSGWLEERCVNNPGKCPVAILDEVELASDLATGCAQQRAGGLGVAGGEEDGVTWLCADVGGDALALCVGDVLGDRATEAAILSDGDVSQALSTALFCPLLPSIELTAWLGSTALHDDCADVLVLEHAEGGVLEEVGALDDLDVEAQVGLIGAVVFHGIRVGHTWDWGGDFVADELPQGGNDLLSESNDIILIDEGHLNVELGELRLAVSAEVLVAVAASNLVVALHTSHHQQLLEQLRGLRQCVPGAWLQTCRHEEVACTLRGGASQGWGLDLSEIVAGQDLAGSTVRLGAQAEGITLGLAAQVEVAVLQTGLLADLAGGCRIVDLERQCCGLVKDLKLRNVNLDLAGRQVGVLGALWARLNHTGNLDAVLGAQVVGALCNVGFTEDDLSDAGTVTQVDEDNATVVTATGNPAGQGYGFACDVLAELASQMSAQHCCSIPSLYFFL